MSDGPPSAAAKLEVEQLTKRYGDKVVLDHIDLTVREHEVVCLIGPSGSGKSTFLRCIDLLEPVDGGRVLLDGVEITGRSASANAVRRRIGIVFQSFNLFPHMRVLDNVTLGPRKAQKVPKAEAEARAIEVLGRLGLAEHASKYPEQLSGGQQQRVALARCASDPELLLLDEITSALDPELVGEVLSSIRDLAAGGMTMVLATHEMGFARDVGDRVAFLHEGRVLEEGPPERVLKEPTEERTRQFLRRVIEAGSAVTDPLRSVVMDAADERFPPADGGVTVVPPDRTTGLHAILSFTAHAVVATDRSREEVLALGIDGLDGTLAPDALRGLAGPDGWLGVVDVVLVARGPVLGGRASRWFRLPRWTTPASPTRSPHAVDVQVLADDRGLVTFGRGLGGRTEIGFEVADQQRSKGLGRALLRDMLAEMPAGEPIFASCVPGNAQSLRSLLAAGFRVIGAENLIRPAG